MLSRFFSLRLVIGSSPVLGFFVFMLLGGPQGFLNFFMYTFIDFDKFWPLFQFFLSPSSVAISLGLQSHMTLLFSPRDSVHVPHAQSSFSLHSSDLLISGLKVMDPCSCQSHSARECFQWICLFQVLYFSVLEFLFVLHFLLLCRHYLLIHIFLLEL